MLRFPTLLVCLLLASPALPRAAGVAWGRQCNAADNPHCAAVQRLAEDPRVRQALAAIERNRDRARADLIELTQIEAPPFGEEARARRYAELLREAGADSVWLDDVGNAIGLLRGTQRDRTVVIEGHLDTVFPEGTDVTVQTRGDTLLAPGIADDTRGLVAVLHVLHGMTAGALRPEADVLFIGTVGEEGLGDLRGVKHLFRDGARRIDTYIAVEPGEDYLTVGGIGSHRYRVTFRGPGGHSWGAFGTANPIHALGRAIRIFDERADAVTRDGPRTSYNVGRIGGGTSVNSVAFEAWLEVDMRSEDDASLRALDAIFQESVRQALDEQNRLLRRGEALTVDVDMVGRRPSGSIERASPLVRRGEAVIRHFRGEPAYRSGSTNSNVPFSLGVPAVTIGAGGHSGDAHALTEWWVDHDGRAHESVQQALLLLLLEAGLATGATPAGGLAAEATPAGGLGADAAPAARLATAAAPEARPAAEAAPAAAREQAPIILITGSTDGLGREVARQLAAAGAHVIVHGRNAERGTELVRQIEADGRGSARFYRADLASLEQVRQLGAAILRDYDRLDVLVNNAGIGRGSDETVRELSADGHELRFGVNYLAGFLLTRTLLPLLIESAPARIVNVASLSATPIDFDDVMLERGYTGGRAYGQSKLAQVLFTFELARRLEGTGVTVNALHPATMMPTTMVLQRGGQPRSTIEEGVEAVLRLATGEDVGSGQFFNGTQPARANAQAYDAQARARLWRLSEALTGG